MDFIELEKLVETLREAGINVDNSAAVLQQVNQATYGHTFSSVALIAPTSVEQLQTGSLNFSPNTVELLGRLKQAFDPNNLLSPGNYIPRDDAIKPE